MWVTLRRSMIRRLLAYLSISKPREKRGFALIITLSLISFVFLLVITLISQIRLDFSYSDARQNQILAKAHARMGMMVAIGEIQKHLGPDMRISTTADIYDDRIESEQDYLTSGYPINSSSRGADLHEGRTNHVELGQRQWTGVWKHRGGWAERRLATPPLPENRDDGKALTLSWSYDSSYDPHPAIEQAWLVSGNEGWDRKLAIFKGETVDEFIEVPEGIIVDDEGKRIVNNPMGGVYGEDENPWIDHTKVVEELDASGLYHHPLIGLEDPIGPDNPSGSDQTVWLLKNPILREDFEIDNPDHQETWTSYLSAEPVKVLKTALHLNEDKRNEDEDIDWNSRSGSYAYWVGDEGVKAKINIMKPFKLEDGNIVDLLSDQNKLKVAAEPNIQNGSFEFDFTIGAKIDDEQRKDLITSQSVKNLLEEGTSSGSETVNHHYHSMTTDSFGVLADVRTGGLKRDLSQVFSLDQESSNAWKKDFADNFIFRDRVRAMKNIPLQPNAQRNQWFVSANDATVDDPDALLAGTPWSVLADYHNLKTTESVLEMEAPDQFPRTVGDNALIFGRRAPNSPRDAFRNATEAYPYFNCFSSSVRKIRPEPKNHPILPVFVKSRLSISPVATDNPGNFCLGINPSVTLWNPYDKSMRLKDLFVEIPFSGRGGQYEPFKCSVTQVDFREYDLYRKWWAYMYGDFNASFELRDTSIPSLYRPYYSGEIKNWKEPWGIYDFQSGTNSLGDPKSEQGLVDRFMMGGGAKPELGVNMGNWNNRVPPDSMLGIKLEGNVFYHENPRDGMGDYTFTFHSFAKKSVSFSSIILAITSEDGAEDETILGPGEVATFAAYASPSGDDVETNQPVGQNPAPPRVINVSRKPSGEVEKGFVWDSGFALNKDACGYVIEMGGLAGYLTQTAERFEADGVRSSTGWSSSSGYREPKCFTLWQGDPALDSSVVVSRMTRPRTVLPDLGRDVKFSTNNYLSLNLEVADVNSPQHGNFEKKLFGLGWEVSLKMPGDVDNERIPLVEFNTRALVHSTQHGQGDWLGSARTLVPSHHTSPPQLKFTPAPSPISYDINGTTFAFNTTSGAYSPSYPKSTPDIYIPLATRSPEPIPNINNITDPDARANVLGFSIKATNYDFEDSDNPDFLHSPVVSSAWGQERIGFFSEDKTLSAPYTGKFSDSSHAVLFEVPKGKILSLLQYRHANFNNYLHGPSYAFGNSYATTQVARHRSWGRVQSIEKRPTSEGGLTNVARNMENEEEAIAYYRNIFGSEIAQRKGLVNFIQWDIDPQGGFAPWRFRGADMLNHQNTTIDYSYYLNVALMDGFFLSGSSNHRDFTEEKNSIIGQRFRPYLWDSLTGDPVDLSEGMEDMDVVGNHRLIGYFRDNAWESSQSSYGEKSKEQGNTTSNDSDYRFQSLASDLILDGAFNINSTSVDAWIAQLSSLRGHSVENVKVGSGQTPVIRFLEEPETNEWNKIRLLSDGEIEELAKAIVKQVKLRGPFLSMADFVNRRLALGPMDSDTSKARGTRVNFVLHDLDDWSKYPEDKYTVQGLRGAVQSAIAESGLNDPNRMDQGSLATNLEILGNKVVYDDTSSPSVYGWLPQKGSFLPAIPTGRFKDNYFNDSIFGLHASSKLNQLSPNGGTNRSWGVGSSTQIKQVIVGDVNGDGSIDSVKDDLISYPSTNYGEAPENLLAVEHLATGANKPGWVMQADLLSPLMPVTSPRSDTFVIRVMGETNEKTRAKAWAELVVQRTPDYVKSDLDSPHHRPHEPFKDINLNGYWDNGLNEHWIDLNRNGDTQPQPDLPGVGELGKEKDYRDGMLSDLKLQMDPQEEDAESSSQISYQGINQRFGRKFKIVRFRWLREDDV